MSYLRIGHRKREKTGTEIPGYRERRYQMFAREEGIRLRAFSVKTGKTIVPGEHVDGEVDIGIGFHLGRKDAAQLFARVLGLGASDFEAVRTGGRTLTAEQVRLLFEETVLESEALLDHRLAGVELAEHERLALLDMAYASGGSLIGPKITAALKAGDRKAALAEILWNSHGNRAATYRPEMDRGVYMRRYREAVLFAGQGSPDVPPLAEYMAHHLARRERA